MTPVADPGAAAGGVLFPPGPLLEPAGPVPRAVESLPPALRPVRTDVRAWRGADAARDPGARDPSGDRVGRNGVRAVGRGPGLLVQVPALESLSPQGALNGRKCNGKSASGRNRSVTAAGRFTPYAPVNRGAQRRARSDAPYLVPVRHYSGPPDQRYCFAGRFRVSCWL